MDIHGRDAVFRALRLQCFGCVNPVSGAGGASDVDSPVEMSHCRT